MNTLPDVLFVTHRIPYPPDKGDRIRTYYLLRFLAQHARVHLASLADEPPTSDATTMLGELCHRMVHVPVKLRHWNELKSLAIGGSISEGAFHSGSLSATIQAWAKNTPFAVAMASASSVAKYLKTAALERSRKIVDLVDVDSQKWFDYARASRPPMSWIYSLEGRRTRKLEQSICRWADAVTLVSEAEAALLTELTQATNVHAITNGVNLDYFSPSPPGAELGCVFVGALDYFPNVEGICWFARTVWPNVRHLQPEARLSIVGRKPMRAVTELRAIPGVDVVGQVPDVRPYVEQAAVVVAPLRIARGLQNKVLEAMASGKAVVASPAALAGFGQRPDLPAIRANDAAEWVAILSELFTNDAERRRLGQAGRSYAEINHNWNSCLAAFRELLSTEQTMSASSL